MRFIQRGAGRMTATSRAGDRIEIQRAGKGWVLTVLEAETGLPMHTHAAPRQFLCCQEACRFFGVGAYADQEA